MNWQLAAIDMDGTLLELDGRILPEVVAGISSLVDERHHVVLASGRPREDIDHILLSAGVTPEAEWPAAIIANERDVYLRQAGSLIPDSRWNNRLYRQECDLLPAIRGVLEQWLTDQPDSEQFTRYDDEATEEIRGVVALCGPDLERVKSCRDALVLAFDELHLPVQVMRNREMVVLRHREICKGKAVLRVADQLGVRPADVLAIGDSHNDRGMLDRRQGFTPACPANAEPEIQCLVRTGGGVVADQPNGLGVLELLGQHEPRTLI